MPCLLVSVTDSLTAVRNDSGVDAWATALIKLHFMYALHHSSQVSI